MEDVLEEMRLASGFAEYALDNQPTMTRSDVIDMLVAAEHAGYVLVPVVATHEMLSVSECSHHESLPDECTQEVWERMLSARPQPLPSKASDKVSE